MEEGKVTSTIDSYVGDIRGFLEFLESKRVNFRGNLTRIYISQPTKPTLQKMDIP